MNINYEPIYKVDLKVHGAIQGKIMSKANGVKDAMWRFLMIGSHSFDNDDIDEMTEAVDRLITMATQKNAGQAQYKNATQIDWGTLNMELMRIVCYATTLRLSGRLEELRK